MLENVDHITKDGHSFEEPFVMLWFSAEWCGPCKQMSPIIKMFEQINQSKLRVLKLDAEEDFELAQLFGVRAVPTLILLGRHKQLGTHVGSMSLIDLTSWIKSLTN